MRSYVGNRRGFAMLSVLMLLMLALALGATTMFFTLLDFKSTQSFATGNQALAAGESGIFDAINTINTRGVVNVQNDIVNAGLISTATTTLNGYSNDSYQLAIASGTTPSTDAILTVTGNALLSAQRVIKVTLQRDALKGGPGALHLSNDTANGSFSGNSMVINGNNYAVADITTNPPTAAADPSIPAHPAISTRNDTVSTQVISALAGQGTIIGLGSAPSVWTTAAASTADLQQMVNDILLANGGLCNRSGGGTDYWVPGPCNGGNPPASQCGVHCVHQTHGSASGATDFWGNIGAPTVTYILDPTAKIAGGSYGAGVLIFSGDIAINGNFSYCGWVLFMNPSANGITIGGNVSIYGELLSPLATFGGNGSISIYYSNNCLQQADAASINGNNGNLPHPVKVTAWAEQ